MPITVLETGYDGRNRLVQRKENSDNVPTDYEMTKDRRGGFFEQVGIATVGESETIFNFQVLDSSNQ